MAVKTFTTGEVLTAADTNTYLANSGLVYVGQNTATSGNTLNLLGCFTADYDAYKVVLTNIRATAGTSITFQLLSGSTPVATNYAWAFARVDYLGSSAPFASGFPATVSSWDSGTSIGTSAAACTLEIQNPFLAQFSYYQVAGTDWRGTSGYGQISGGGTHTLATSYTGLRINTPGTFTNIQAVVYGYRKA